MAKTDNLTDFLTNTADAIRTAEGSTNAINPQDFEAKITALKLSVQTADANATAADILSGKTAWVKGTKISGSIGTKAATTIIPGTSDQTIASGVYLAGAQTIKGDANLIADNIKSGTSIFGVTGTYEGEGGGDQPQLNTPTISITEDTLTITPNKNNGNFVTGYNVYVNPGTGYVLFGTTTTLTNDLTQYPVPPGDYSIKVTAVGENFIESDYSNELNYTNVFYTITNTLTNCTSNNTATSVRKDSKYSATFAPSGGYTMVGSNATVIMNGIDVTSTCFVIVDKNTATLSITNVSGDISVSITSAEQNYLVWTEPYSLSDDQSEIGYSEGKFYTLPYTGNSSTALYSYSSTDGVNWSKEIVAWGSKSGAAKITTLNGIPLLIRFAYDNSMNSSAYVNGKWENCTGTGSYNGINGVFLCASSGTKVVAVRYNSMSSDQLWVANEVIISGSGGGNMWTVLSPFPTSEYWQGLIYGNNEFLLYSSSCIYKSTDGETWTQIYNQDGIGRILYANGKYYRYNYNSVSGHTESEDGINWTYVSENDAEKRRNSVDTDIVYGNGLFVQIPAKKGTSSSPTTEVSQCKVSDDFLTWENVNMSAAKGWCRMAYGDGKFVALSNTYDGNGAATSCGTVPE